MSSGSGSLRCRLSSWFDACKGEILWKGCFFFGKVIFLWHLWSCFLFCIEWFYYHFYSSKRFWSPITHIYICAQTGGSHLSKLYNNIYRCLFSGNCLFFHSQFSAARCHHF